MKTEKILGLNLGITKADLHLDDVLYQPFFYEQELVKVIVSPEQCVTARTVADAVSHVDKTIKIEGLEKLSRTFHQLCGRLAAALDHDGPVTCHLFLARKNSESFPEHTDPDNVLIYVVDGEKTMKVGDKEFVLQPGEALFLPHGTPHQALNRMGSIMLSFGLERFLLEKIQT